MAACLVRVMGLDESRAYFTMRDAHRHGIAEIGEYPRDVAELYDERLIKSGNAFDVVDPIWE